MPSAPPPPVRHPRRPGLLDRLFRRGREYDPYTGEWVREGWIAERQRLMDQAMSDPERVTGTCNHCGQSIALHPPERMWTSDRGLCPQEVPDDAVR